jgi:hypothetical protein
VEKKETGNISSVSVVSICIMLFLVCDANLIYMGYVLLLYLGVISSVK